MEKIYIYQIYFPTNNKCYIGQTNDLKRRMKQHLNSGSLICKALLKVNNWTISILHTCKTRDEANRIEIEEIRNFNSVAPNGYNLTAGGEGGDTFTDSCNKEITREKISRSLQGNQRAKGNQNGKKNKGRKHSAEELEKMSKAMQGNQNGKKLKGYKHTEEAKENMSRAQLGNQNAKGLKGYKHSIKSKKRMLIGQLKRRIREFEQGGVA